MASNIVKNIKTSKDNNCVIYWKYKYYYKRLNKDSSKAYVCSETGCSSSITILNGL